jgi:Family of unknown function (DUF6062)
MVNISPATIPILEAFERNEGCVLCSLWLKDEFQSMEFVEDNEISMDQAFRKDVADASGFCNRHMHVLYRTVFGGGIPDGLGYAMYAQDSVEKFHETIQAIYTAQSEAGKKSWNVLSKERTPQAVIESSAGKFEKMLQGSRICEICRRMLLADARRTRTLVDMLGHEDFAERFSKSGRLCFPHFVTSIQMVPTRRVKKKTVAALLVETEMRCLAEVDHLLGDGGKASPEMAAMMIAGVEGLYCVTKKSPNPSAAVMAETRSKGR